MPDIIGWIGRTRHPLLTILLIGTVIRIAIGSLSVVYDSDFWVLVIRNLEAGEGLYGMHGYFYTPVWGYILGLVAALQDIFLDIGESAVRVAEALFVEGSGPYFSATIPIQIVHPGGEHTDFNEPGTAVEEEDYLRFIEKLKTS